MQFRVAVCDDDRIFLNEIKKIIAKKANQDFINIIVDTFETGNELCRKMEGNAFERPVKYNLILLDIMMEGIDGVDVARLIRDKYHAVAPIVFITYAKDRYEETSNVRVHQRLPKPVSEETVLETLDFYLNRAGMECKTFSYSVERRLETVELKKILYFEGNRNRVNMYLDTGEVISFREPLKDIYERLDDYNFFFGHKSYLINAVNMILDSLQINRLTMKNGKTLKISHWNDAAEAVKRVIKDNKGLYN